ncbi:MAG TPA: PEGA domain-containing protein [Vicinamibacterales bacterium]|jgi:hypothetical protein|nr:PEGA domain-containing protein [Vicinamibacterales bacterium]
MRTRLALVLAAVVIATSPSRQALVAAQAQPRGQDRSSRGSEPAQGQAQPRGGDQPQGRSERRRDGSQDDRDRGRQAPPDDRQRSAPPHEAQPRRQDPPPRVDPHRPPPRVRGYAFPPVSPQRRFYYHPRFGFYFGPYYGPFYPPANVALAQTMGAVRLRVRPVDTQVFVNGYYAGVVDDFDGVLQRLYLPPGEHAIELYRPGFRTFRQALFVSPRTRLEIVHQMVPLTAGEPLAAPLDPEPLPDDWTSNAATDDAASSPLGILALQVDPSDAQIVIDGDVWMGNAARTSLVIHLDAGRHRVEVRKAGYAPFKVDVDLSAGTRTRLAVHLDPTDR